VCGRGGRKLKVRYQSHRGRQSPAYPLPVEHPGREPRQLVPADQRRSDRPGGRRRAARRAHTSRREGRDQAAEELEHDHDTALKQWRLQVERARYQADRAERRYAVIPTYEAPTSQPLFTGVVRSRPAFDAAFPQAMNALALLDVRGGATAGAAADLESARSPGSRTPGSRARPRT
jgi:hypothetical protein